MGQQLSSIVENLIEAVTRWGLSKEIKYKLTEWIRSSRSVSIFVTGKTGSGKSTLVNALLGQKLAEEGTALDPMTSKVKCYKKTVNAIQMKVWDSPGLQDGTGREAEYIADMKAKCTDIDLCVFCFNVSTARFTRDSEEVKALQKLTDALGRGLWDNAVIALTFANELEMRNDEMRLAKRKNNKEELCKLFQDKIAEWDNKIRATLTDMVKLNPDHANAIPIIPTGFQEPLSLPDRDHWLSSFWFGAIRSMHEKAQPAMVILNIDRLVKSPKCITQEESQKVLLEQRLIFSERGYEIGDEVGRCDMGQQMGASLCYEVQARVLIELESARLSELQKQNKESVDSGLKSISSVCGGTDMKG